jgi:hypothetical protein
MLYYANYRVKRCHTIKTPCRLLAVILTSHRYFRVEYVLTRVSTAAIADILAIGEAITAPTRVARIQLVKRSVVDLSEME